MQEQWQAVFFLQCPQRSAHFLRSRRRVRHAEILFRASERAFPMRSAAAQQHFAFIDQNAHQPGFKPPGIAQGIQAHPCLEKRFLHGVFAIGLAGQEHARGIVQLLLARAHPLGKLAFVQFLRLLFLCLSIDKMLCPRETVDPCKEFLHNARLS